MTLNRARFLLLWVSVGLWLAGVVGVGTAFIVGLDGSAWLVLGWVVVCEVPTVGAVLAWSAASPGHWLAEGYRRGVEDATEVASIRRDH